MKIKTLIKQLSKLNPNAEVIIASDAEGNSHRKLYEILSGFKFHDEGYEINFYSKKDLDDGDIEKEDYKKMKNCIILYPE